MATERQRMLLVGAYERDNFGDLLFLLQTEQYLPESLDVVAAAPFAADMSSLLDRHVPSYGPLLESERFDHVWTVGGEVGGADLRHAFRMVATEQELERWRTEGEAAKAEMIREHIGQTPIDSPYMPRPAAYPLNLGASLTLNSVGFAGVAKLPADRQQLVLDISRAADRISVRDQRSSTWLTQHGLPHTVAPDLVHTIARTRPWLGRREDDVALVQVSKPEIRRRGLDAFADAIARSQALAPFTIRFFVAGTAPGHDSVEIYEALAGRIRSINPNRKIEISDRRRPYDLVDEIAAASLWVGLSLHGRIISSAYGVPRVSFAKQKVDAYASTWDPEMPWGVTPDRLDEAVVEALSPSVQRAANVGDDLAQEAESNILAAVRDLDMGTEDGRIRRRLESAESWRRWLADQRVQEQAQIKRLRDRIARLEGRSSPTGDSVPFVDELCAVGRRGAAGIGRRLKQLTRKR